MPLKKDPNSLLSTYLEVLQLQREQVKSQPHVQGNALAKGEFCAPEKPNNQTK